MIPFQQILLLFTILILTQPNVYLCRTETRNIEIVTQQNAIVRYPDLANRIICQNITDKYLSPTLQAADDFVVPLPTWFQSLGVAKALEDCSSISFAMDTIRTRSDANPTTVTLEIYHHNPLTRKPSEDHILFKKTFYWPSNNYQWQSDILPNPRPFITIFTIQYNELGDDGRTRFNFRDPAFLPSATTFWVSFYVTVSQHASSVGFRMNSMYWRTLDNHVNSTPKEIFLHGGQENYDFVFRDREDLLHRGYVNWTTAEVVERVMEILPTTNNLALTVSFSCLVSNLPLEPTFSPTSSPTSTSHTNLPSAPTSPNNKSPSSEESPIGVNETGNGGGGGEWDRTTILSIIIPLTFLFGCLTSLAVVVGMKKWEERKKKRNNTLLLLSEDDNELPSTNMRAIVAKGTTNKQHDNIFENYELPATLSSDGEKKELSRNPLIGHTSRREDFVEISLDHSPRSTTRMKKSMGGNLFNNTINTTIGSSDDENL